MPPRPTAQPDVYVPQPGSPLRIPIIDIHHGGMRGDPRSIQTTKATTEAIEKACEEVFGNKEVSFEEVRSRSVRIPVGRRVATVASLADIVASKEASGRPKDLAQLPILRDTLRVKRELEGKGI